MIANDEFYGCFSVNSATDIYYILKKAAGVQKAKDAVSQLLRVLYAVSVTSADCAEALATNIDDFEDALIVVCAEKIKADCIISRDRAFQSANSPVPVLSPEEFIKTYVS